MVGSVAVDTAATIEVITALSNVHSVYHEWQELWNRCVGATPFLHPAWVVSWLENLRGDSRPAIFTVRRSDRLVALVALVERDDVRGRRFELAGAGVSDYLGGLFSADTAQADAELFSQWLCEELRSGETAAFQQLRPNQPLLHFKVAAGFFDRVIEQEPCQVLCLAGARDLSRALPVRMQRNLRYYRRRLERCGSAASVVADDASLEPLVEAFFALHAARWQERRAPGVLGDASVQRFHRAAAKRLLDAGLVALHAIRIGERIVATAYCLQDAAATYYYLGGFDPALASASPGSLVVHDAILRAVERGAAEFDFLRGREAYKKLWGARDRATFSRELRAP